MAGNTPLFIFALSLLPIRAYEGDRATESPTSWPEN